MQKLDKVSERPDFLMIAFEEYLFAMSEERHLDSEYVRKKSYARYESELAEYNKGVK